MTPPLQEPTFLVLTALLPGPLHGYAVRAEVEAVSGGRVRLRVGTLYAALDRLTREGLVAVDGEEVVDGRLRRYHRVTAEGERRLEAETDRLEVVARQARRRLRRRAALRPTVGGAS